MDGKYRSIWETVGLKGNVGFCGLKGYVGSCDASRRVKSELFVHMDGKQRSIWEKVDSKVFLACVMQAGLEFGFYRGKVITVILKRVLWASMYYR